MSTVCEWCYTLWKLHIFPPYAVHYISHLTLYNIFPPLRWTLYFPPYAGHYIAHLIAQYIIFPTLRCTCTLYFPVKRLYCWAGWEHRQYIYMVASGEEEDPQFCIVNITWQYNLTFLWKVFVLQIRLMCRVLQAFNAARDVFGDAFQASDIRYYSD